jgi:hypothetical protein
MQPDMGSQPGSVVHVQQPQGTLQTCPQMGGAPHPALSQLTARSEPCGEVRLKRLQPPASSSSSRIVERTMALHTS